MDKNFLKATSKSVAGKTLFYIFEFTALAFFVIEFILAIILGANAGFSSFLSATMNAIVYTLIIFALGKIIDLLYLKNDSNKTKEPKVEIIETEDK